MKPRFNLPEINFAEKSVEQIDAGVIARYEEKTGRKLSKADPRYIFLQTVAAVIAQERVNIDYAAKQNLLSYAEGEALDHIGVNTPRLGPNSASITVRFNFSILTEHTIPAGTRVTAGDGVFFALEDNVTVTSADTSVEVTMVCTTPGEIGNGYKIGTINQLVDPLPWVQSVENITESSGGTDVEKDDPYAERIRIEPESYSTAGPTEGYKYWAKTASSLIVDVSVTSPSPGVTEIRPLLEDGELPTQAILDAVLKVCSAKNVRPQTDFVQTLAPEVVEYEVELTYWISSKASAAEAELIKQKVNKAIEEYKKWQRTKQGRDIDPSELVYCVKKEGASRVQVTSPIYQVIEEYQVAKDVSTTVTYGGIESA